jgi:hypothetical protein
MAGRKAGRPMFGKKTKQGSHILTREAWQKMRRASKRTGKSESDVLEYCVRKSADGLTREEAQALSREEVAPQEV